MDALKQYTALYDAHRTEIDEHSQAPLNAPRTQARERLQTLRLPRKGDEECPALSVQEMFAPDYGVNILRMPVTAQPAETFRCGVPNISTLLGLVVGDTFAPTSTLQRNLPQGVEVMSLARAAAQMPQAVAEHYDRLASTLGDKDAASAVNTMLAQDGVWIRVRRGVRLDKPIQIVNILNSAQPTLAVRRVLVVMEPGSSASVLMCDHSANAEVDYLCSQVAEVFLGEEAQLGYYDLEESSERTSRVSALYCRQQQGSTLTVNGTTLVGGRTRNCVVVDQEGEHATTRLAGMAIAHGAQVVDNSTRVLHNLPQGHSDQMYKYILDGTAQGSFYGTIVVDERAKHTKAYQSNRNILADTQARMYTRPQLEIYCDEVKCSHGATVGQLDQNAMFYMRSRGIPQAQARLMLMQAFMADVIDTVEIPALRARLHQLIEQRLAGAQALCADCGLNC